MENRGSTPSDGPASILDPPSSNLVPHAMFLDALRSGLIDVPTGSALLVGVSGGADSVALLVGLVDLRDELGLRLHVGHLDHGLRDESTTDAKRVADLAGRLDVPVTIEKCDVAKRSAECGVGLEEAGRRARYTFFEQLAAETGCPFVAVAHTADDQAETVLHHVLRGTGLDGLRGMPRHRPLNETVTLIRPLLDLTRQEIERFLADREQPYADDPSNSSNEFTRNRIRHELLPLLERAYNPNVRDALRRLAAQAVEAGDVVRQGARELLSRAVLTTRERDDDPGENDQVLLDPTVLREQSDHVMRAAFVELWRDRGWPRQRMGFTEWQRLVEVVRGDAAVQFPGHVDARLAAGRLVLTKPS